MQWDGDQGDPARFRQEPEDEVTRAAGVVFALTGAWRAAAARTADLTRARRALAIAAFKRAPGFIGDLGIIPAAEEQALGTVGSIWRDCRDAATSARQFLGSEVATRIIETIEEPHSDGIVARPEIGALGPFEDVTPGQRRSVYVEVQYGGGG
jgi:hypothetical protein